MLFCFQVSRWQFPDLEFQFHGVSSTDLDYESGMQVPTALLDVQQLIPIE